MTRSGIIISDEALPYLTAQRGAIDDMRGDTPVWCDRYAADLFDEFDRIKDYLPETCDSILDVGSGLGGIDALINDHYDGKCHVTLMDGVADPPNVQLHRKTFNHMGVAQRFLAINGVDRFSFIDANDPQARVRRQYDLIVSFKSWCFHVHPLEHIDLVLSACHRCTVLIVDVRRDKMPYLAVLKSHFNTVEIYNGPKASTLAMLPKI